MTARVTGPAGVLVALGMLAVTAVPARAAPEDEREALAAGITKACRTEGGGGAGGGGEGRIAPGDLARVIFASRFVGLKLQANWIIAGAPAIAQAAYAMWTPGGPPQAIDRDNQSALLQLALLAHGWAVPEARGNGFQGMPEAVQAVRLLRPDGASFDNRTWPDGLRAVLAGAGDEVIVTCAAAPADQPSADPGAAARPAAGHPGPALIVGNTPADLVIPNLGNRSFAEVSLLRDADGRTTSLSVNGTVGLRWGNLRLGRPPASRTESRTFAVVRPLGFVQLQRQSVTGDPWAIDNLSFGLQADGFVQSRSPRGGTRSHYFALSGLYITDTRFLSRSLQASARIMPDLKLPGFGIAYHIGDATTVRWLLSAVADYTRVEDSGRKSGLAGVADWTRVGYDARAIVALQLGALPPMDLTASYDARYALAEGPGRAAMLRLQWLYHPDAHLSFGLAYENGTNLDNLFHTSTVKATLGFRN